MGRSGVGRLPPGFPYIGRLESTRVRESLWATAGASTTPARAGQSGGLAQELPGSLVTCCSADRPRHPVVEELLDRRGSAIGVRVLHAVSTGDCLPTAVAAARARWQVLRGGSVEFVSALSAVIGACRHVAAGGDGISHGELLHWWMRPRYPLDLDSTPGRASVAQRRPLLRPPIQRAASRVVARGGA